HGEQGSRLRESLVDVDVQEYRWRGDDEGCPHDQPDADDADLGAVAPEQGGRGDPIVFRLGNGFAHNRSFLVQGSGLRDPVEPGDQVVHRDLAFLVGAGDAAAVQHVEAVDDRIDVKDVVVDEDRRLARLLDVPDELQGLPGLAEGKTHGRLVEDDELGIEM